MGSGVFPLPYPAPHFSLQGVETGLASPSAIAVGRTSGKIYVANQGSLTCEGCACFPSGPGSITVYAPDSSGDSPPVATIAGPHTGLGHADGVALDSSENIYVLTDEGFPGFACVDGGPPAVIKIGVAYFNRWVNNSISLRVFAAGSNGDTPPIASIEGPLTALNPSAIAVGPAATWGESSRSDVSAGGGSAIHERGD